MKKALTRGLLLLVVIAALFALCAVSASAQELTPRQAAIVDTAKAYYYKGHPMQYDSVYFTSVGGASGGDYRSTRFGKPEDATKDNSYYTVCSSYCVEVYLNAIGFNVAKDDRHTGCESLIEANIGHIIYQHKAGDDLQKIRDILQPGDMIVVQANSGLGDHAMMYVGDILDDGHNYILHSWGKKYDIALGNDPIEEYKPDAKDKRGMGGNIRIDDVEVFLFADSGATYNPNQTNKTTGFFIFRPLDVANETQYPITSSAKARAKWENIVINRTASVGLFGAVANGETVTYEIEIINYSKNPYTALPVKETVPANTELVKAEGAKVDGKTLTWTLDVPAGETKTVSYTVKATGKRGDTIVAENGDVGGLPSNTIKTKICGKQLPAMTAKELVSAGSDLKDLAAHEFISALYGKVFGVDLKLDTAATMARNIFKYDTFMNQKFFMPTDAAGKPEFAKQHEMLVDRYYGGLNVQTGKFDGRVFEMTDRQLQPGDVVYMAKSMFSKTAVNDVYIVTSDKKLVSCDGHKVSSVEAAKTLSKGHSFDIFFVLRPVQAYDDITVEAKYVPTVKFPFTDVKEGDWYYEFVKELYEKKIVSGMTETTFVPNGKLTYGQALKLIVCGLGKGEQAATGAHWASGYLTFAKNQNWLDKDVDLNGAISRLQFCQIAAKAKNLTAQPANNPFKDCADKDVLALVNAGIINGMSADTFAPDNTLTRAQISKIISGLIK